MEGMNKEMVKAIAADLQSVIDNDRTIKEIGLKFGVQIRLGNCTYDPTGIATWKLVASLKTAEGVITKEASYLDAQCREMGIPTVRGKTITLQGKTFTIIGYKANRRTPVFLGKRSDDGKTYLLPENDALKQELGFLWEWEKKGYFEDGKNMAQILVPPPTRGNDSDSEGK